MKNKMNFVLVLYPLLLNMSSVIAQQEFVNVDFLSKNWKTLGAAKVIENDSKATTVISEGVGIGYIENLEFQNGVIECDIFSPTEKAYLGIIFRVGALNNFECIYFQPHTSGKWDAVQYDPIFNSSATWQLYNGKLYQAKADIPTEKWFHVKIDVNNDTAKVFLNNNKNHTLAVKLKHKIVTGSVGVYSYHPAKFKNLRVLIYKTNLKNSERDNLDLEDENYISNWYVSNPYDNYNFKKDISLVIKNVTKWNSINVEENRLLNLNRYFTKTKTENTVLARVFIHSNKNQIKKLKLGYSDKVRIFLNSKKIYTGDNTFVESKRFEDRGYVIDKHKSIDLNLQEGENELLLEISEDKFGWGFITQFSNLEGIKIFNKEK